MKKARTDAEIAELGSNALVRALGYGDAVRFITNVSSGKRDYSQERPQLFKNLKLGEIVARVDALQADRARPLASHRPRAPKARERTVSEIMRDDKLIDAAVARAIARAVRADRSASRSRRS